MGDDGIELRHLRYFVAVAEAGTITGAARRLRVAQPSLSQQIQALERRVGAALFRRSARGMELSGAGEALLGGARHVIDALHTAIAAARDAPMRAAVGVCRGATTTLVAEVEAALRAAWPDRCGASAGLEVSFEPVDSARQTQLLYGGDLDIGILRCPIDSDGLVLATVSDEPLGVVVHSTNPLAAQATVDWQDLARHRLLWFPDARAPGYAAQILAHVDQHGWAPRILRSGHASHTLFIHALQRHPDLVALRPLLAVAHVPDLAWRPFARHPPRERLALATTAESSWAPVLKLAAQGVQAGTRLPARRRAAACQAPTSVSGGG